MFERQIRLSRYDADKLLNSSTPGSSRMSSQHREISSPTRSRSISPNDMAVRQRRTITSGPMVPSISTALSLPVSTSYPDLVISHTPPTETPKISNEQILINTHHENLPINKEKKLFIPHRNTNIHEQNPLSVVIVDESSLNITNNHRPNLLLPSTPPSDIIDAEPLDFKSRLALFNRTNTQRSTNIKKSVNQTNFITKPVVHHQTRLVNEEEKDVQPPEPINNQLSISIARSVINTAKAVTFFGGNKLNGNSKSTLPTSIPPPPPPPPPPAPINDQSAISTSVDLLRAPDIIGGNVKLNKSSIFSGGKRVLIYLFFDLFNLFHLGFSSTIY
jgi:hypothetical protein